MSNLNASRRCIIPPDFTARFECLSTRGARVKKLARQPGSFTQKFFAHVFQNVSGAFDPDFSGENRVFIFNTENAFEADVHISLDDRLPKAGAVTIADSAERLRG